jgi:hypothetical protein
MPTTQPGKERVMNVDDHNEPSSEKEVPPTGGGEPEVPKKRSTSAGKPKGTKEAKGDGKNPGNGEGSDAFTMPSNKELALAMAGLEGGLPNEAAPPPPTAPSQPAVALSPLLQSALAPGDVNFDEAAATAGPVRYTSIQRRKPRADEPFRILPRDTYGSTMLYMLSQSREGKGRGEHDSYVVTPKVRAGVVSQPHTMKRIRRHAIVLAVNSFGVPFFIEVDMDSTHHAAQAKRELIKLATEKWMVVFWDEVAGQHVYKPAADQTMKVVAPVQSFTELLNLTYNDDATVSALNHKVLMRQWIAV